MSRPAPHLHVPPLATLACPTLACPTLACPAPRQTCLSHPSPHSTHHECVLCSSQIFQPDAHTCPTPLYTSEFCSTPIAAARPSPPLSPSIHTSVAHTPGPHPCPLAHPAARPSPTARPARPARTAPQASPRPPPGPRPQKPRRATTAVTQKREPSPAGTPRATPRATQTRRTAGGAAA
eukprot:299-Chlamydomonas_euryale.AAC.1